MECHKRFHGIELPDQVSTPSPRRNAILMGQVAKRDFRKLDQPIPGSVLLIRVGEFGAHVGFMINQTRILHTIKETGAVNIRLSVYERQLIGAYEYVGA